MAVILTVNQETVLGALGRQQVPPTVRELSELLGLPRSSTQVAIVALVRRGLAEQAGVSWSGAVTFRASEVE